MAARLLDEMGMFLVFAAGKDDIAHMIRCMRRGGNVNYVYTERAHDSDKEKSSTPLLKLHHLAMRAPSLC